MKNFKTNSIYKAELFKERLYGSITLIAVNIGLLSHSTEYMPRDFLMTVIGTSFGLFFASTFATIIAYKITHEHHLVKEEIIKNCSTSRGLLHPVVPSIFFAIISAFGFITLRVAIMSSIIIGVLGIISAIIIAFINQKYNIWANIFAIIIQIFTFVFIIFLKIGH